MTPSQAAQEKPTSPRTEAGRTTVERLRDLFASWESMAEYHNIATDELYDPLPLILAIEDEAGEKVLGDLLSKGYTRSEREAAATVPAGAIERAIPEDFGPFWDEVRHIDGGYTEATFNRRRFAEAIATRLEREAAAATPSLDVERLARAIQADIARRRPLEAGQPLTAWSEVMRTAIFIRDHYEGDGR